MLPAAGAKAEEEGAVPSPALLKIEFLHPEGGLGSQAGGYVEEKEYTDEYRFAADFRMRFSSIEPFINLIMRDNEFFFIIDSINMRSIRKGSEGKDASPGP